MTISSTNRKAGPYVGTGLVSAFPFAFKVFSGFDVLVVRSDSDGAETVLTLNSDYTVSLNANQNANPGGTITLPAPLPSGFALTASSALPYLQPTDLTNNGGFYPAVINTALDRLTIFVQQLAESVGRSLKTAISTPVGVHATLPAPIPDTLIAWNSSGNGFQNVTRTEAALAGFVQSGAGAVARDVQNKLRDVVSAKDFGAKGDGSTDDTAAVSAAIAECASSGRMLYWPAGSYLTSSSIPNLHTVRHQGPGAIRRGSDTFYPDPPAARSNTLYVSPSGVDANDGLSASQPFATVQAAFDTLKNYGPVLNGTWAVQLAAGTYNASANLIGLRSKNNIVIRGPSVGGHPNVPTAIIDGTGVVSSSIGWYLQFHISASIYDVKFQNWTAFGDSYGFNADGHCQIYMNNCHAYNCLYAGFSFDNLTQIRMQGGIVDSCTFSGVRLYSQVSASIGYNGSVTGDSTEIKNCGVGISGRVSSRVHIDYCNIHNNDTGVAIDYNSRCVVNYTKTQNNNIGWFATLTADIQTSYDGSNTTSGNAKDYVCYSSVLSSSTANECNYSSYWDEGTKRWLYGASSYRTPNAKYEWQMDTAPSGSNHNGSVRSIFDYSSATNYHALSSPATSYTGICWTAPGMPAQAIIAYSLASDYMDFWTSGTVQYRMQSTQFVPLTDNTKALGGPSFRWSTVYAGTGAINTSDARDKQDIEELTGAELRVAQSLKSLFRKYRFKDAVAEKGEDARIHVGVLAQDVKEAFEREGLDGFRYAVLCWDEWVEQPEVTDEGGNVIDPHRPAGNRYGIRYDELYAFIFGALANA